MQIQDKVVFVTGANRGIGKAIVETLLKSGAKKVYAAARKVESLPDFADNRVTGVTLDITNTEQISAATEAAGDTQLLINNAGVAAFTSLFDGPLELAERDMQINYFGTLNVIRAFIPSLEKQDEASIANVTSIAAFVNFPIIGGYSASKAALFSLTQGARIELAAKGIKVHSINPGPIDTEMATEFDTEKETPENTAQAIIEGIENDVPDIFPDAGGKAMFDVWNNDYRELEAMVSQM